MLKPIANITDVGIDKFSEVKRASGTLDRLTGDIADLRVYADPTGTRRFLRVWADAELHGMHHALWFEIVPADVGRDPRATK